MAATRYDIMNERQIAWQKANCPAFAKSFADVQRRDADVAANRAMFNPPTPPASTVYPSEAASPVNLHTLSRRAR